jgi:hypothetical protein
MKRSLDRLSRRISTTFYSLGVASLVISLVLSLAYQPANASEMIEQGPGNCDTGWVAKVESAPFVYNGSQIITSVYVKSATNCFLFSQDGSNGCYAVSGIGTTNVTVTRVGVPGPSCQEISHVEFYSNETATPTNTPVTPTATNTSTSTPTNTPVIPTATNTSTSTPTNTPVIPTATNTSTSTPTNTPVIPTATNTSTATPTNTAVTPTATATDTPIGPTATPTSTQETPTPTTTETQQTPTGTDNPQVSTPTPTETSTPPGVENTPTPTSEATSTPPATLPPPNEPTRTPLLVPVTGIDLTRPGGLSTGALPSLFFNLGLLLLGLGLVVHGLGNHLSKKDHYAGFEQ